jgi:hypothetical protein
MGADTTSDDLASTAVTPPPCAAYGPHPVLGPVGDWPSVAGYCSARCAPTITRQRKPRPGQGLVEFADPVMRAELSAHEGWPVVLGSAAHRARP